jgi:predicted MPP superfamily phosphohydrolase
MPPRLVEHELAFESIDKRHDGFRIAHLTDVHCGRMTPAAHVRRAVELANEAKPDVIIMTGDYVNWDRREVPIMQEQLSGLSASRVFVTLGNHDYFTSGRHVAAAMRDNGYTVLKNEHITIEHAGAPLHVVGIDDPVTRRHDIDQAFSAVPEGGTRVVACHCPERVGEVAEKGAHLMLSGHTHGGQINVRGITDRIFRRAGRRYYNAGFYNVDDTVMYLSAGVGFSGVRVRAGRGTRSEVSLFTLRSVPDAA